MSIIKVSKKIENMNEVEFLKLAMKELQEKMKTKGDIFAFDIAERETKIKSKINISK